MLYFIVFIHFPAGHGAPSFLNLPSTESRLTPGGDVGLCKPLTGTEMVRARWMGTSPRAQERKRKRERVRERSTEERLCALLSDPTSVSARFSHTARAQTWLQIHPASPLCFSWLLWRDAESRITRSLIHHTKDTSSCITDDIVALCLLHLELEIILIRLNYGLFPIFSAIIIIIIQTVHRNLDPHHLSSPSRSICIFNLFFMN